MENRGRKNKYESHVKPYLLNIKDWCRSMTEQQIAETLGISYSAWNQYKQKHQELNEIIQQGRKALVGDLRSALIKKALGFDYVETKVTTERFEFKPKLKKALINIGFEPEALEDGKITKTEVSNKHAQPDVAAINLALKNYDADNWANDPQTLEIRKKELELKEKQIENNNF